MIIKFKRPAAIFCGIILMVFGLLFLLYAVFGMNGDEDGYHPDKLTADTEKLKAFQVHKTSKASQKSA